MRSLAGYSSQGHKESDMAERLTQHPSPQFRTLSKGFVKLQSFLWYQLRALLKLYHSSTLSAQPYFSNKCCSYKTLTKFAADKSLPQS